MASEGPLGAPRPVGLGPFTKTQDSGTVTIEMRRELARELAEVLENEVEHAEEFHSTEQIMQEGAEAIRRSL